MSIGSELGRIFHLRERLTEILQQKSIISSGSHDLEDDVVAVEALNYTYQQKSVTLGSAAPSNVSADSGYTGLSRVNLSVSGITGSQIMSGHKILGVTGTAQTIINLKKIYWNVSNISNASALTLQSSDALCYPSGSFTPGNALPNITSISREIICLRTYRNSDARSYNEANFLLSPYDFPSYRYAYLVGQNSASLIYSGSDGFVIALNRDRTTLTLTLNDSSYKFKGNYIVQILYS